MGEAAAASREEDEREERIAAFLDAVVEGDPRSKAGVERTDGFLTHDELLARIRH